MNKIARYTFGAVFLAAVSATGYETYKLNELVWSAPEIGDVTSSKDGKIATYTLDLERNKNFVKREDFSTELSVYFGNATSPDVPTQVCIRTSYKQAGIFSPDLKSPLLKKYIDDNPKFKDFTLKNVDHERIVINNTISFYTHKAFGCTKEATNKYQDELKSVIIARRQQLGLN